MPAMRGLTIKLPDSDWQRLRQQARATGRSVAAIVRERVSAEVPSAADQSVHASTADLAGALAGAKRSATNQRRRFQRR